MFISYFDITRGYGIIIHELCKISFLLRDENLQGTLRVTLTNPRAATLPVRKYVAVEAKERAGAKVRNGSGIHYCEVENHHVYPLVI
jgi:hypothetical protein